MSARARKAIMLCAATIAIVASASCAYFNTLYNARRLYREAEKSSAAGGAERERREKYQKVIEKCATVITEYPKSRWVDDAVFLMGLALTRQGEYDKGIRKFQEIITNFPESDYAPRARYHLAEAHYFKQDYEPASAEVERFLSDYPRHELRFETMFLGGDIKRALKQDEEAIAFYERVAETAKDADLIDEARVRSGDLFFERGDWQRAASNYERVLRKGLPWERRYRISLALAECRARTGACEESLQIIDDLLARTAASLEVPPLLLTRALGFECLDSLESALAVYDNVITRYPKSKFSAEAYYRKGVLFDERLDSLEAAEEAFSKVGGEYAKSDFAPRALEKSISMKRFIELEREGGAGESREQAAEKKFMSAEIQLLSFEDARKALAGYTAVIDSFPCSALAPRAAYAIAWIYQHSLAQPDTAIDRYRSLVERYPRSPQVAGALYELGELGADELRARLGAYADSARSDTAAAEAERLVQAAAVRADSARADTAAAGAGKQVPSTEPVRADSVSADSVRTPAPPLAPAPAAHPVDTATRRREGHP